MYNNTTWYSTKIRLNNTTRQTPYLNTLQFLLAKTQLKTKHARRTQNTMHARWPEQYMEPTEYFLAPRKQTYISIEQNKLVQNIKTNDIDTIATLNCDKCVQHFPVPIFYTQLDDETTYSHETAQSGGEGPSSLNDEESRLVRFWALHVYQ